MQFHRIFLVLAVLLLGACNLPAAATSPTPDLEIMVEQTQAAIVTSVAAAGQATGTAIASTAGAAPTSGSPAATQLAQATPAAPPAAPVQQPANCTNLAKFVGETVPDGSAFPPNTPFMKTWTIQNAGTCTWTPEYALVFSRGEQMGGTSPQPIGQTTPPGGSLQIYLPQTSPAAAGEHQGFWMLRSPAGGDFALGQNASVAFWVKIRVSPGAPAPTAANPPASIPTPVSASTLGPPSQTWSFNNNKAPFYLGDDSSVSYKVNNNMLIMTAFTTGDMWRVAEGSYIANFALEARFVTGAQCAGRDSYGLLARAPSQPDNIIDSGYIFTFNCDGQFRIYRMDNGNYTGLYNWTNAPSIRAGANQENVMQVAGQGAMLSLSANGQLLAQFNDPTYSGGLFGLIIGSGGTPNLQVGLRQLSLWTLP